MKRHDLMLVVPETTNLAIRQVAGLDEQVELHLRTADGDLTIRLIARRGHAIRVSDLRARDKRRTPKLSVPFLNGHEDD